MIVIINNKKAPPVQSTDEALGEGKCTQNPAT
jgi:hypothetical protein